MVLASRAALIAVALSLVLPAAGWAQAQTHGNPLTSPANAQFGCETRWRIGDPEGNYYPGPSGVQDCTWWDTSGGTVPADGTVQRVTIRTGPNPAQVRFVVLRTLAQQGTGTYCCAFAGESPLFTPVPNAIQSFDVNLPVQRNTDPRNGIVTYDNVGVSAVSGTGTLPLNDRGRHNAFDPVEPGVTATWFYPRSSSADGAVPRNPDGNGPGWEVLLQTTFCPAGQTCGGPPPPPPDRTAPVLLGRPAFGPNVFRVAPGATPVVARANRGSKLSFTLSEASTAAIRIEKPAAGRRKGRSCVAPTKKLRRGKKCKRWKPVGTLTRKGLPAGKAVVPFTGRIGTRALRPGRYRAAITATDAAGNASKVAIAKFGIVR